MNEITKDEARPLTDVELDAVTGGLATPGWTGLRTTFIS
jgi:hypothetical protein